MTKTQGGVALNILAGTALTLAALFAPLYWSQFPLAPVGLEALLALWLLVSLIVVFWLIVAIGRLARHRFFSAEDIDGQAGGPGTSRALMLQSMLQNTLEQALLAIVAYGAWFFLAPPAWRMLPVLFVVLFSIGRLLFFAGYSRGAAARALGFTLTFYPTVVLILILLVQQAQRIF